MGAGCGAPTLEKRPWQAEKASDVVDAPAAVACVLQWEKKMSLSFRKTVKHLRWSGAVEQACWARFPIKKRVDVMVQGCFEYVKLQSPLMIDGSEFCNNG
jgi:hypothetical protein